MMARLFRLAGLLRLRHLQQDQAASQLALANGRMRENNFRQMRARTALGSTLTEVANTAALHAVAAARAAARSTLADLEGVGVELRTEVDQAQVAFDAARSRAVRLEKLEGRHADAVAADDIHAEQASLDEIASRTWHHRHEGAEE
jgi:flagellar protein FliJ